MPTTPRPSRTTHPPTTCPECDYTLEGLPPLSRDHPCPECGHPANLYAPPDQWLRHADRRWLSKVILGLRFSILSIRWMIGLLVAGVVLLMFAIAMELVTGSPADLGSSSSRALDLAAVTAVLIGFAMHSASCILTGAPSSGGAHRHALARRLTRVCGAMVAPSIGLSVFAAVVLDLPSSQHMSMALSGVLLALFWTYLVSQVRLVRGLEFRTAAWIPQSATRHKRMRKTLWSLFLGSAVLDAILLWQPGAPAGTRNDDHPALFLVWLAAIGAYGAVVDGATKPALKALLAEYRAGATPRCPSPPDA